MIMDKFKSIFLGLEIAYGQYQPGERGENGKQQGKAFIVRGTVTDELWDKHLRGEGPALGIIPITEDNSSENVDVKILCLEHGEDESVKDRMLAHGITFRLFLEAFSNCQILYGFTSQNKKNLKKPSTSN